MKELYVITVELDEKSEYFSELTPGQAQQLRAALRKTGEKFKVIKIRTATGFHPFELLLHDFKDWAKVTKVS